MIPSLTRTIAMTVALVTLAACKPGTSVGSPAPGTTATPAAAPAPTTPAGVTPAAIAEGKTLYETQSSNCVRCHGLDAKGNQRGPDLTDSIWVQIDGSYPAIVRIITAGVPAASIKGNFQTPMRAKGGSQLTDAQINSVAAYIYSISHK
jgi:mono/diheme cytochrome c family protein